MRGGCVRCRANCARRSEQSARRCKPIWRPCSPHRVPPWPNGAASCRSRISSPTCRSTSGAPTSPSLIAKNQVVIVCGETGSGKTTQLPKICLDLGLGARGLIGHTQPRRLAARSVATRLAQELKTQVGAGCRRENPLPRQVDRGQLGQADDRRHPARRVAVRPLPERLRDDHHRRGARAQPEHRFPARLSEAAATPAAGPEADHHLGDHRCRTLFAAFQRRTGDRGFRPALSGRRALPAGRRSGKEG